MILLTHIVIALASVIVSTGLLIAPSGFRLRLSYGLIAGTFVSGTVLIVTSGSHLLETCLMGLAYAVYTAIATIVTSRRMAAAKVRGDTAH